jgi:hypothetical protein
MWIVPVLVLGTAILVGAAVAIHRGNRHPRRGAG